MVPITVTHATEFPQAAVAAMWSIAIFFAAATLVLLGASVDVLWRRWKKKAAAPPEAKGVSRRIGFETAERKQ